MNAMERFLYGGQVMLIGLIIVFAVLLLLIFVISLLSAAIRRAEGGKAKPQQGQEKKAQAPVQTPVVTQAAQEETPVVENATDDAELLAVIAAALASFDNSNKLIVRSVRRVSGWKNANRAEQVSRF